MLIHREAYEVLPNQEYIGKNIIKFDMIIYLNLYVLFCHLLLED